MKKLDSLGEFDWISKLLWSFGSREDGGAGHTIRHVLPDVFECYFKILHPMYRDKSVSDKSRRWAHKDEFRDSDLVRVSWKALADEYNVPYQRQIHDDAFTSAFGGTWPRYLIGADDGELDMPTLIGLGEVLSKHTSTPQWYFEYFLVATQDIQSDELYVGELADLPTANDQSGCNAGPTYLWPSDHAWCVFSDCDLPFTIIGSTRDAADDITSMQWVEWFEMQMSDRIDHKSHSEVV